MSIADFFFGRKQNSTASRRKAVRPRNLSMEPLENRELLSVTPYFLNSDDSSQVPAAVSTQTFSYDLTVELPPERFIALQSNYETPDGYNEYDYQKAVAFLEQTDEYGVKNGTKLNENYDPADPTTWGYYSSIYWNGVTWTEGDDGVNRISKLILYLNTDDALVGDADFSGCTALETLQCYDNQLTSLDVSGCTALNGLICHSNQLTSLDVSGCTALTELECDDNPQLTSLNVSDCTALEYLECVNNQLTSLDVSGFTALGWLYCMESQLTSLDVSGCTALETLQCDENQLTSLDVSSCTALTCLCCTGNQLTSLDVSNNTALDTLFCNSNQLTSLDLTTNNQLCFLNVGDSYLSSIFLLNDFLGIYHYIRFMDSSYDVTNSQGVTTVSQNTSYKPTELPFTARNTETGHTIYFYKGFHFADLALSTDELEVGTELTATVYPLDAATLQWYCGNMIIPGATGTTLTVTEDHIGKTITCLATGTGAYAGTTAFATTAVVPAPIVVLDVPTDLALSAAETTVTAAWSAVENASAYTVEYQAAGSSSWTTISDVEGTSASFLGTAGTTYNVRVKANGTESYADSEYSEIEQIILDEDNKPIIAVNGKKISVLWTDASLAADSIRYRATDSTKWTVKKLKAGVTEYSFTGALGKTYEIEVLLDQQETNVLQGSATVLDQPKLKADKAALKDDTFQVNVTNYAAKNLATNAKQAIVIVNGVQTTFNIENQTGSAELTNGGEVAFANGLFTFTEMNSATSYKVLISFSDGHSVSKTSSALTVKTTKTCYQTPVITSAEAVSDTSITVKWETTYGKNSDSPAQKYTVQYSTDGVKWKTATTATTGNSYTIQKLKGGKEYKVRVLATKDKVFESSLPSEELTAETLIAPKTAIEKNSIKVNSFQLNVTNYQTTNLVKATSITVKSDKYGETVINLENGEGSATFDDSDVTVAFENGKLTFTNVPSATQQKIQVNFSDGVCTTAWSKALKIKTTKAA